jgi:hypothetical protein
MSAKSIAARTLGFAGWLVFLYCGALIAQNSLGYFHAYEGMPFVEEKTPISAHPVWRWALITHAAAGIVCFAASILQFFRGITRRWPGVHRWLGRIYAWAVLGVVCPTGFYLSLFAKGGLAGQAGFLLLGALTLYTTSRGVSEMVAGRTRPHIRWMIRSFAMVTTAITFRVLHIAFSYTRWEYETNYLSSLWLSILGNAVIAEWLIRKFIPTATVSIPATSYETPIQNPQLDPVRLA